MFPQKKKEKPFPGPGRRGGVSYWPLARRRIVPPTETFEQHHVCSNSLLNLHSPQSALPLCLETAQPCVLLTLHWNMDTWRRCVVCGHQLANGHCPVWPWLTELGGVVPSCFTLSRKTVCPGVTCIQPEDSPLPLLKAIVYPRSWVRKLANSWPR